MSTASTSNGCTVKTDELVTAIPSAQRALSRLLGVPVHLAYAVAPLAADALTADEQLALAAWESDRRRRAFCRGRAALRAVSTGVGPRVVTSISHDDAFSVAASVEGAGRIGVDVEARRRTLPTRAARFFLTPTEAARLAGAAPEHQLRAWTVKEALFKADPANAAHAVGEYECADVARIAGAAAGPGGAFRYASVPFLDGWLTVAVHSELGGQGE